MKFFRSDKTSIANYLNKGTLSALTFLIACANAEQDGSTSSLTPRATLNLNSVNTIAIVTCSAALLLLSALACARCCYQNNAPLDEESQRILARTEFRKADERAGLAI